MEFFFRKRLRLLTGTAIVCVAALGVAAPPISQRPVAAAYAVENSNTVRTTDQVPEPGSYRTDDYRKPVPQTLRGATPLSSTDAMKIWSAKTAIFVDVYPHAPKPGNLPAGTLWRETTHQSIEDAVWLPNVGYGVLSAATDGYFRRHLETLTKGDKAKPLVFFCLRNCWMSWNAAKRALSYGYKNVDWYRDGSDGWQETGGFVVEVRPLP
jgi:PQQ-dependent catabolism-associated CXXCW motif protein